MLEIGYPRNDVLSAPDREERRADVRRRLGIPDDVTAVLYTPTFRDDAVFAERSFELALDVDAFVTALGVAALFTNLPRVVTPVVASRRCAGAVIQ